MSKPTLATVWLDGCSGCHMSFLDIDERLLDLAALADLIYSPLVDRKDFPDFVDITLVEGAVSSQDDLARIRKVRAHTKVLVSLGDCAITSNVPGMRNSFGVKSVLDRAYVENVTVPHALPSRVIPVLLEHARPIHEVVPVDVYLPGCPPSADLIFQTVTDLLAGRPPHPGIHPRFGA
jgi:NAD-reducing hydrogenase small subunit